MYLHLMCNPEVYDVAVGLFPQLQVLGMIKGLSLLMHRMEGVFSKAIHHHIHHIVQEFIQLTIRDPLRGVIKKKKHQPKT